MYAKVSLKVTSGSINIYIFNLIARVIRIVFDCVQVGTLNKLVCKVLRYYMSLVRAKTLFFRLFARKDFQLLIVFIRCRNNEIKRKYI